MGSQFDWSKVYCMVTIVSVLQLDIRCDNYIQSICDIMMIDATYGLSYGFHSYIIQDDSRLSYMGWYRLQVIQASLAFITGRLVVAFLVIWTHIWPIYRYPGSIYRWYRWMFHSDYRDPLIYTYLFYLQGCMSSLYLQLDLSDHCGTFSVGLLTKYCTGWTTHLVYSEQLIRR